MMDTVIQGLIILGMGVQILTPAYQLHHNDIPMHGQTWRLPAILVYSVSAQ